MQKVVIEQPYKFIPPETGTFWSSLIQKFDLHGMWLRRAEGIVEHEIRNADRLKKSLQAGHGVMLTPNHCRYADPIILGWLAKEVGCHVYAMASWHLFHQSRFVSWAIRKMGGFSVYREGVDRQAIDTAIATLVDAQRPLIVFPEGAVSRTNDRLHAMLDGVAFIARTAAKKRARADSAQRVVVHPVAIKYLYQGDIREAAEPVLDEIEKRFTWRSHDSLSLMQRIARVGSGLLALKEIEVFARPQDGSLHDRLTRLADGLLQPLEQEWLGAEQEGPVVPRVKALRMRILPDMVNQRIDSAERQRRWRHLADVYLAQQVSCYPADYLVQLPSVDRVLETIERFEEDLFFKVRVHGKLKAVIDVLEPIEVATKRDRSATVDPLMEEIRTSLSDRLEQLSHESAMLE